MIYNKKIHNYNKLKTYFNNKKIKLNSIKKKYIILHKILHN